MEIGNEDGLFRITKTCLFLFGVIYHVLKSSTVLVNLRAPSKIAISSTCCKNPGIYQLESKVRVLITRLLLFRLRECEVKNHLFWKIQARPTMHMWWLIEQYCILSTFVTCWSDQWNEIKTSNSSILVQTSRHKSADGIKFNLELSRNCTTEYVNYKRRTI